MDEEEIELKPCPFCGGEAEATYSGLCEPRYFVKCTKCGIRTDAYQTPESEMYEVWNSRSS